MKKISLLLMLSVFVTGCASFSPTVPEGYTGPVAYVQDTENRIDRGKADLFYLSKIDGNRIESSMNATGEATYGRGANLHTVMLNNKVPAAPQIFTLTGRTTYAMPIRAMASTVYEVKGDIEFTPKENEKYVIKGELGEEYSAVWLEELSKPGEVIDKVEVNGSAALGFFQK